MAVEEAPREERYGPSYGTMAESKAEALARGRLRRRLEALAAVLAAALSLGVLLLGSRAASPTDGASAVLHVEETAAAWQSDCRGGVCLFASNAYERLLGRPIGDRRSGGSVVVEVYRDTHLEVEAEACAMEVSGPVEVKHAAGCSLEVRASVVGSFEVSGRVVERGSRSALVVKYVLMTRYVRREIRDVTPEDRQRYLDAVAVATTVDDDAGRKSYGPRYRSVDYFVRLRLEGAQRDSDPWHWNPAFLTRHVALAAQFERSLQSIDQRVALPYWDFTADYAPDNYERWPRSVLYREDWFSTANPENAYKIVDAGRFAFTPVRTNARAYSAVTNPYGLLAAPWSTNPTPFVTRTAYHYGQFSVSPDQLVSCDAFARAMRSARTLSSLADVMSSLFETFVAVNNGGAWNYDSVLRDRQDGLDAVAPQRGKLMGLTKAYWRNGYVSCPALCAHDAPQTACACGLSAAARLKFKGDAYAVFNSTRELSTTVFGSSLGTIPANDSAWRLALDQVANGGYPATLSSDAAPNDPIYWLLAGLLERYVHQVRYLNASGAYDFDDSWTASSRRHPAALVYDWHNVKSPLDLPKAYRSPPPGSRDHDLLPFDVDDVLMDLDKPAVTNAEYFNLSAPFSPHLRYVYDRLLNWTTCGFAFGFYSSVPHLAPTAAAAA